MITLKKIKSVISAVLCICMISAVFTGCGKNGTGGAADGERAEKIAKEPKKISFLVPGYDGSDKDSYYTKAIKEFEKNLDTNLFFKTHRSYIVNVSKINEIIPWFNNTYKLKLDDINSEIPVSRSKIKDFRIIMNI